MKKILKSTKFLAFIIPIFIILIAFILTGNTIDNQLFVYDMSTQYVGLLGGIRSIFIGKESILYSFTSGLGTNFLTDYFYYLISPLNFITTLFPLSKIPIAISIIIVLKCGLMSFAMSLLLKKVSKISDTFVVLLSACYGLMEYFVSYYCNVMWLDALILMPLVLIGIEELLSDEKEIKYIIFMSLVIISNYYISFMCMIFSVLYFISRVYELKPKKEILKYLKKFIKVNFITICICSFVLIPSAIKTITLFQSRGIDYLELTSLGDRFKMLSNIFLQSLPFQNLEFYSYIPRIYCSFFVAYLCFKYFLSKKISKKSKIAAGSVILIFIICFMTNIGNYLFSGMSHAFAYYFRYSFFLSLYMIILAARYLEKNSITNLKIDTKAIIFINMFFVINIIFNEDYYWQQILFFAMIINSYFYIFTKIKNKNSTFKFLLVLLVFFELLANCYYNFKIIAIEDFQYDKYALNCPKDNSSDRYIYESYMEEGMRNSSMMCGTGGVGYSSSNLNYGIKSFFHKVGANVSGSLYNLSSRNTELLKKILGVKYYEEDFEYKEIKDSLPIGYMVNSSKLNNYSKNPFEYQNSLISSMIGEKIDVMVPFDLESTINDDGVVTLTYKINKKENLYFYVYNNAVKLVFPNVLIRLGIDGKNLEYTETFSNSGIKRIAENYDGDKIKITIKTKVLKEKFNNQFDVNRVFLYYEDLDKTNYAISKLSKNKLNITRMEKNILEGNVLVGENKILFLSIPYDEGWNVLVDGKKTKYFEIYEGFIGINLEEGNHEIKMTFYPQGLKTGCTVSIISIILTCVYYLFRKKIRR